MFSSDAKDPDHNAKDHARINSMGSQAEMEWKKPVRGVDYVFNDSGQDTPDVFREHRHRYSEKPKDLAAYRRQITFRCGNIGTKELEIVLRDYLTINSGKMTYADLEQFDADILDIENPQLQRYLMNGDPILPEHDKKYMRELVKYVHARKTDYKNNVPGIAY